MLEEQDEAEHLVVGRQQPHCICRHHDGNAQQRDDQQASGHHSKGGSQGESRGARAYTREEYQSKGQQKLGVSE